MTPLMPAEYRYRRIDLVRGVPSLSAGIEAGTGADAEWQTAKAAQVAVDRPAACNSRRPPVVEERVSLAERQLVHVIKLERVSPAEARLGLVEAVGERIVAEQPAIAVVAAGVDGLRIGSWRQSGSRRSVP